MRNLKQELKKTPDDMDLLNKMVEQNYICGVPSWEYVIIYYFQDDSYIIDYAQKKNGFILTNDRYNDHIEKYSNNDDDIKNKLKNWIRSHCIRFFVSNFSFTFANDEFIPSSIFLLKNKL